MLELVSSQQLTEDSRKVIYADKNDALILFMQSTKKGKGKINTELTGLIHRTYYQPAIIEKPYRVENIEELELQKEALVLGLKLNKLIRGEHPEKCGFRVDRFKEFYYTLWQSRVFDSTLETWTIAPLVAPELASTLEMRKLLEKNNIQVLYPLLDPKTPYLKTIIWSIHYTRNVEAGLVAPVHLTLSDRDFESINKIHTKRTSKHHVSYRVFDLEVEPDIKDMIIKLAIKTQTKYKKARIEYLTNYFRAKGLLDE